MKEFYRNLYAFFENLPDQLRKHKFVVWGFFVLITAFMVWGTTKLETYIPADEIPDWDKIVRINKEFKLQFGNANGISIIYKAKDGDIFSESSLKAVRGVQEEILNYRENSILLEEHPFNHIIELRTIVNAKYMEIDSDMLISRKFIGKNIPVSAEERETLRQQALNNREYPGLYLSKDSKYGGIAIRLDYGTIPVESSEDKNMFSLTVEETDELTEEEEFEEFDNTDTSFQKNDVISEIEFEQINPAEMTKFINELDKILEKPEYSQVLEFHMLGRPVINTFIYKLFTGEMGIIIIAMVGFIIAILLIVFRSFSALLWPLVVIALAIVWILGLSGWTVPMNPSFLGIVLLLLMVVGIGDVIHVTSGYVFFRRELQTHEEAIRSALKKQE